MRPMTRELIVVVVRVALLALGLWFAFAENALGEGAHAVSRVGLVALCFLLVVLVGEMARMRHVVGVLVGALRSTGTLPGGTGAGRGAPPPDPRASVDILVRALDAEDQETRAKAHRHLVRLTGKTLPPESALWERWWQENREAWQPPAGEDRNLSEGP